LTTSRGRYRHLDHTADLGIEAAAADENALFVICAKAVFDILMGGPGEGGQVACVKRVPIRVEAPDREILMLRWLRELLHLHDTGRWLFSDFEIEITPGKEGAFLLSGEARGQEYDPSLHRLQTELKAVTYHQLSVARAPDGEWRARVIFDI
jgi:SHS2 domain-containing protein